ncbi:MAG: amidohydrolase family protein [Thaumarchaeota archaeon]|nr:amidohydrolase family protein [Nitrososphaerota archaeon]
MIKIIDANVKILESFNADALVEHMNGPILVGGKQTRIEKALVLNRAGFMDRQPPTNPKEYDRHHDWLIQQVSKYPDRLYPVATLNPYFEQQYALDLLEKLVREKGFRALKLHPNLHNYRPNDDVKLLAPVFELCAKLKIPIFMHSGDPFSEPTRIEVVAQTYREAHLVMLHFGTQTVSYAVDAIAVVKRNDNMFLETSQAMYARLKEAARVLGPERLIFGSDAAVNDIWGQAAMVAALMHKPPLGVGMKEEDLAKIMGGNVAKLTNIPL